MTKKQISASLNSQEILVLRTETALSRYPVHNLSTTGEGTGIEIQKTTEKGAVSLLWKVSYNTGAEVGEAGRLAYKLDTLVVNQRIDEATWGGKPAPKVLKLGSLHEIAQELGLGGDTNKVKRALRQNASAFIMAKIGYKAADGGEKTLEADFTRYGVVFLGQQLPDGRKADAVYLVLSDIYTEVLDNAVKRPLDYNYMRELSPIEQRFYEIVSYEIYPAVKYNQRARLPYSEYCLYSTAKRHFEYDRVKKQMYHVHRPHLKRGYLADVEFVPTTDADGQPDWDMLYTPGERARVQQLMLFSISGRNRETSRPARPLPRKREMPASQRAEAPQLPLPAEDIAPEAISDPQPTRLVEEFYTLRYGQPQQPTEREITQAMELLKSGESRATHLVKYAARQGKEGNGFPNDFGGVRKLLAQAKKEFDAQHLAEARAIRQNSRQSHEKAHQKAYRDYLSDLLRGTLESELPEAYRAFKAEEEKMGSFHRARAAKSERSAQYVAEFYDEENRISRLLRFLSDNPHYGIPSFWQWDRSLNPAPYQDETGRENSS